MITDNGTMTSKLFDAAPHTSSDMDYYCPVCQKWMKVRGNDDCVQHRKACIMAAQMRPIPSADECAVMLAEDFEAMVQDGAFVDTNGHGFYANATQMSPEVATPSRIKKHGLLEGWTQVVWFNKEVS